MMSFLESLSLIWTGFVLVAYLLLLFLAAGTVSQGEFEVLKAKALA